MTTYLPEPFQVREFLEGMLGREVGVMVTRPFAPTSRTPATIGLYVDDSLVVRALVTVDLPMSAWSAAALGLVPQAGAELAVEAGVLDEELQENLYEVFNVGASMFNVGDADHVKLYEVHHLGTPPPPEILMRALTLGRRLDLTTDVSGYGKGRISVIMT